MRIRTIKPQFWSHPVLRRLSDSTQLLALGLLNYADDEGYFWADATLVRSALRPFDESSCTAEKSLKELAAVGFIELRDHPSHGAVGYIINFAKHQRVDKPSPSSVKDYFVACQSRSIPGVFVERSANTIGGNKEGNKEKEKEEQHNNSAPSAPVVSVQAPAPVKPVLAEIPAILQTDEFKAAWSLWQKHRREKKQPVTPTTSYMQLRKCEELGHDRAIAAINHSITHGYTGIFEPNNNGGASKRTASKPEDFADMLPEPVYDGDEPGVKIPI